jgi:hypothetical protein
MTELIYLAGALAFATGCCIYDTVMSVKGIKAGVAVEANFTWLYGTDKPSALQYYAVNIPVILLAAAPSIVGYFLHNPSLYFGGLAAPTAVGISHIKGGLDWRALGVKF